tara:strand:- start:3032 stop:3538 length:507 start_codon:yes stop_codon:yes gene_type:complete
MAFKVELPTDDTIEKIKDVPKEIGKSNAVKDVAFVRANVVVESTGLELCFLIFAFQEACNKYGIDYEECVVLCYLYELGLFGLQIDVLERRIRLGDYMSKKFIEEDWSHEFKKLYKLSKFGVEIVEYIFRTLGEKDRYIGDNRETGKGTELKMKGVLSKYFKKEKPLL